MVSEMLAAVFVGEGKLELTEVPVPKIKRGEVLLEIEAASICGTDVQILKIPPGHPANKGVILGHEFSGRIVALSGEGSGFKEGDRVVVDPNITCGSCLYCKRGQPNMCANMTTLGIFINGGFTKYTAVPMKALHKISPQLPPEIAVFAEPLSCVVNATLKLKIDPSESVAILGAGPIGLCFLQVFRASGAARIMVSEVSDLRKKASLECGATRVIDPRKENIMEVVKKETEFGVDVVVDAVGSQMSDALQIVRNGGRVLLFGQNTEARAEITQNTITRRELTVMGSFIAKFTFPPAIKILESKALALDKLITHRFPLERIHEGLTAMREGKAIKVIITP